MHEVRPHVVPAAASVGEQPAEPFTIVAVVRSRDGALERVFGLLRRRAPTLSALNVSAGVGANAASVTATFHATRSAADQVVEQLRKLVDVESATCFSATEATSATVVREFALIRMRNAPENRREIVDIASLFAARIVDVRDGSITIEASGSSGDIENILAMLHPLGIQEIARSGRIAMSASSGASGAENRSLHSSEA